MTDALQLYLISLPLIEGQHLALSPASLSILGRKANVQAKANQGHGIASRSQGHARSAFRKRNRTLQMERQAISMTAYVQQTPLTSATQHFNPKTLD